MQHETPNEKLFAEVESDLAIIKAIGEKWYGDDGIITTLRKTVVTEHYLSGNIEFEENEEDRIAFDGNGVLTDQTMSAFDFWGLSDTLISHMDLDKNLILFEVFTQNAKTH